MHRGVQRPDEMRPLGYTSFKQVFTGCSPIPAWAPPRERSVEATWLANVTPHEICELVFSGRMDLIQRRENTEWVLDGMKISGRPTAGYINLQRWPVLWLVKLGHELWRL